MRFQKIAVVMVGSTILLTGCAQRQYQRSHQHRTYHRPTSQHYAPSQGPAHTVTPAEQMYHADPPVEHPREPSGPSQPVPAPPPQQASVSKIKGVSFTTTATRILHGRSCAAEPCVPDQEGCQTIHPPTRESCYSKSVNFFKRLCPKKPVAHTASSCVDEPCGVTEGCSTRKSCLPKYTGGLLAGLLKKCAPKDYAPLKDPCVSEDGCGSLESHAVVNRPAHNQPTLQRTSPLTDRLEDPFAEPLQKQTEVPAIPRQPVPGVPDRNEPAPPPAPAQEDAPGTPQPAVDVPRVPNGSKNLDPMPENQTYIEPLEWPRLRQPAGRIANVPASQTSWSPNQPTWQHGLYGNSQFQYPVKTNVSPWSTSWQIQ